MVSNHKLDLIGQIGRLKGVNLDFSIFSFPLILSPRMVSLSTISIPEYNILRHLEKPQHLGGFSTQMVSPLSGLPTVILSSRSVGLSMRLPLPTSRRTKGSLQNRKKNRSVYANDK